MKNTEFESGLLSVFRLFVGIRLFFGVFFTFLALFIRSPHGLHTPFSGLMTIVETALLLVYLSWPWLHERLGKYYVPIALLWATLLPILENFILFDHQVIGDAALIQAFAGQWQLIILLLVPLILVSWQYSFRIVAAYIFGMATLDIILVATFMLTIGGNFWMPLSIVVFRSLLYMLVGYVINRLSAEQREKNTRLGEAYRQLARHAVTLEELTISRERNRVARELHDTLAHSLSAVAVQLEAVNALWVQEPQKAHDMLNTSLKMTRDGLNDARRAIAALRTAPVEDMGLGLALKNLAYMMAERGGFHVDVQVPSEMPNISQQTEHSLYRISEEALRNIIEHAEAKNVEMKVERQDDCWTLAIRDDGLGLKDPAALSSDHFGLRGMHERADEIGGSLTIDSRPGQGTTVRVKFEV